MEYSLGEFDGKRSLMISILKILIFEWRKGIYFLAGEFDNLWRGTFIIRQTVCYKFQSRRQRKLSEDHIDLQNKGILLSGPVGCGKKRL